MKGVKIKESSEKISPELMEVGLELAKECGMFNHVPVIRINGVQLDGELVENPGRIRAPGIRRKDGRENTWVDEDHPVMYKRMADVKWYKFYVEKDKVLYATEGTNVQLAHNFTFRNCGDTPIGERSIFMIGCDIVSDYLHIDAGSLLDRVRYKGASLTVKSSQLSNVSISIARVKIEKSIFKDINADCYDKLNVDNSHISGCYIDGWKEVAISDSTIVRYGQWYSIRADNFEGPVGDSTLTLKNFKAVSDGRLWVNEAANVESLHRAHFGTFNGLTDIEFIRLKNNHILLGSSYSFSLEKLEAAREKVVQGCSEDKDVSTLFKLYTGSIFKPGNENYAIVKKRFINFIASIIEKVKLFQLIDILNSSRN
ncbi:hypothetical protein D6_0141 [Aeromonas phage D6]|uniref:Uncharacterized protein n=1 Tax=Aeromonas phage D6 TaxID=2593322 RepID=A0A514TWA0_9CAUD|nr:hypothetical protein PQC08_gp134 [Aeromonas phage D6]QDJ97301.1 hypothetical protein D6_0141 [Aeromonas phage D6]